MHMIAALAAFEGEQSAEKALLGFLVGMLALTSSPIWISSAYETIIALIN